MPSKVTTPSALNMVILPFEEGTANNVVWFVILIESGAVTVGGGVTENPWPANWQAAHPVKAYWPLSRGGAAFAAHINTAIVIDEYSPRRMRSPRSDCLFPAVLKAGCKILRHRSTA